MRLELADFPVKDARFSKQNSYDKGTLEIGKEELLKLILEDKRISSADLDVAFAGEQTRITNIRDVVEPRVKVSGPGCVFPGILGPVQTVGEGRTHRLSGVTVMASAQYHSAITSGMAAGVAGLIDMWGLGSQVTPYGSLINIVLALKLVDSVSELEAHSTIQMAEFKVAHQLAEITRDMTPEKVEVFELSEVDSSLPRVVYNISFIAERIAPHPGIAFYGLPIRESLPVLVHPNELLDGAVTSDARRGGADWPQSWAWLNHPIVLRLLREHGRRLNFLGVILERTSLDTELGKQTVAESASQIARLLGADGAIITSMGGVGNTFFGAVLTVQAYERKGIKTVFLTMEQGGAEGELPLPFYIPEATAMVSAGDTQRRLKLSSPTKVIGSERGQVIEGTAGDTLFSPWGELTLDKLYGVPDGADWWGSLNFTCKEY